MLILLTFIAFSNKTDLEKTFISVIYFGILILDIIPQWEWEGARPVRLDRCGGLDTGVSLISSI